MQLKRHIWLSSRYQRYPPDSYFFNFSIFNFHFFSQLSFPPMPIFSCFYSIVDGGFSHWQSWSECHKSCGESSFRTRFRFCNNPPPSDGGKACHGDRLQVSKCPTKPCAGIKLVCKSCWQRIVYKMFECCFGGFVIQVSIYTLGL